MINYEMALNKVRNEFKKCVVIGGYRLNDNYCFHVQMSSTWVPFDTNVLGVIVDSKTGDIDYYSVAHMTDEMYDARASTWHLIDLTQKQFDDGIRTVFKNYKRQ